MKLFSTNLYISQLLIELSREKGEKTFSCSLGFSICFNDANKPVDGQYFLRQHPSAGQCAVNINVNANGNLANALAGPAPCLIFARAGPVWGPNAGGRGEGGCSPILPGLCLLHASARAGISGPATCDTDVYVLCHSDGKQYFVQIGQPMILFVG